MRLVAALAAGAWLWAGAAPGAAGGEVAVEHGKINTADASPVDPGGVEVEVGYSYSRSKRLWDRDEDTQRRGLTREHGVSLAVTAGVVEGFDVSMASSFLWLRDDDNDYDETDGWPGPRHGDHFGDLEFGGRYRFLNDEQNGFEAAYLAGFTAPVGSGDRRDEIGTTQDFWSFEQSLAASKDWGRWTANAELGYSLPFGSKRDEARGVLSFNLAAGCQVLSWLQPEIEFNYEREFDREEYDPELISGTAGLVMPVSDLLRINAGVQEGLWGRNADKVTTLILAVKFAF